MDVLDTSAVLTVAVRAARVAGARIRSFTGGAPVLKVKADFQDLVTATDRDCQDDIQKVIREAFGEAHLFLGEEDVPPGAEASAAAIAAVLARGKPVWVVDPIDGTTNFASGLPISCVSIGVADATGSVVVGVIYDPHRDELFHAVRGGGAFLNGAPMRVAAVTELRASLWGWGLHHARHVGKTMLRAADTFADEVRGLRGLGSAVRFSRAAPHGHREAGPSLSPPTAQAIELAYVACGRLAGFFEFELCAWDLAAGSLLVEEAGGRVTGPAGQPYNLALRDVLASCGPIHDGAMALLVKAGATKADDPALWPPLH